MKKASCHFQLVLRTAVFLCFLLCGCASSGIDSVALDEAFYAGDYSLCAELIQNASKSKKHSQIDRLLDIAILEHYAKSYEASSRTFSDADRAIEAAYTKSIAKAVGAASLNEGISEYAGNVYEYILLNAFNSLNYYNMGERDEALVEIRKIEIKQKEYIAKYGELALEDEEADYSSANSFAKSIHVSMDSVYRRIPRKPTEADLYKDSAFAHYLAALLYLQDKSGSPELHAREYSALSRGAGYASLKEDLAVPAGMGRLDIISLAGKIIERQEGTVYIPSFAENGTPLFITSIEVNGAVIPAFRLKYVYPYVQEDKSGNLIRPPDSIQSVTVTLDGGDSSRLKLIEWFDDAVRKDVAVKARKEFTRSIVRSTAKKAAAVTSASFAISAAPEKLRFLAEIAAVKSLDAVDLAETADVRQCRYFPSFAAGGGFTVRPGMYSGKIEYFDAQGNLAGTDRFENIRVSPGEIAIVESVCVK